MAQDARVGVLDGAQHAGGHLFAALLKAGVDAGDHHVHLGQHFVVQVERAVGEDVDLDAGEDADAAFHLPVDFADALNVFERALLVEAIGHGQVFGVVGDGDVLVAAGQRGLGHLADGVVAVGGGGVHVHVALEVGRLDEAGQLVARRQPRFRPGSRASRAASSPCPARRRFPLRWPRQRSSRRRAGPAPTRSACSPS